MSQIITKHTGGMAFDTLMDGHKVTIDADSDFGGEDNGPKPKPLILLSLSGCTGMDVVSLMNKMRVEYADFEVKVDAELTDEHPKYYHKIHLTYSLKTKPEHHEKIKKAVNLSQERYCGVSYMLSKSSELTHEIDFQEL
ncbi:MAG: OsmC family peroxiredoxin [Bacteroidetes bacterium]|nr:MAG: OsmC family peroxiredoxin [Bacteroidota bacterium]